MFKRVLVPLDSTPLSEKVLSAALRSVDSAGELIVLRVRADAAPLESVGTRNDLDQVERETLELVQRATTAALVASSNVRIRSEVRSGPLAATILDAATELEADLIVMGTHGRRSLTEQLTGSVTERIVAQAAPSVFVVKAEGYPFLQD